MTNLIGVVLWLVVTNTSTEQIPIRAEYEYIPAVYSPVILTAPPQYSPTDFREIETVFSQLVVRVEGYPDKILEDRPFFKRKRLHKEVVVKRMDVGEWEEDNWIIWDFSAVWNFSNHSNYVGISYSNYVGTNVLGDFIIWDSSSHSDNVATNKLIILNNAVTNKGPKKLY